MQDSTPDTSSSDTAAPLRTGAAPQRAGRRFWHRVKHVWSGARLAHRTIDVAALSRLEQLITASERAHTGQIRLCIEGALPPSYLHRDATARERALAVFAKLQVWDTEHNNGVLVYLLVADHAIEIVADRALRARVDPQAWEALLSAMRADFRSGAFEAGLTRAIDGLDKLLKAHFPRDASDWVASAADNLSDRPVLF